MRQNSIFVDRGLRFLYYLGCPDTLGINMALKWYHRGISFALPRRYPALTGISVVLIWKCRSISVVLFPTVKIQTLRFQEATSV